MFVPMMFVILYTDVKIPPSRALMKTRASSEHVTTLQDVMPTNARVPSPEIVPLVIAMQITPMIAEPKADLADKRMFVAEISEQLSGSDSELLSELR